MYIIIDGKKMEAKEGETILEVAERAGIKIPTICYYKGVFSDATCRICVVELFNGKIVPACAFPVSSGLEVRTNSERVRRDRRTTLELLLSIHKIRCQSCPRKGGNCELLSLCKEYGVEGMPICAECPLHGEDCLLAQGKVCLGPITIAGCDASCTRERRECEGCRGPITRPDVIREAISTYKKYGIPICKVLEKFGKFCASFPGYDKVVRILEGGYDE